MLLPMSDSTIVYNVSTNVPRPNVPPSFRRAVFYLLHSLSHPGIWAKQGLVTARFLCPSVISDVRKWARTSECTVVLPM